MGKFPSSTGKVPRGKGGSRPLDHPGCGSIPTRPDNKTMNPTAPSGGKAHKSSGGGERKGFYPNAPKASGMASFDGKLNKTADKW